MVLEAEYWSSCLLNAKVVGDPHGHALMAYCGIYGSDIIAGYGRWKDTLTPYAYGINDFINLPHREWDSPPYRLVLMPKNKGVTKYINEFAPIWKDRSVNGRGEVPEARDEWVRAAEYIEQGKFIIAPDYKVFKEDARRVDNLLTQVGAIAERDAVREGQLVRISAADLKLVHEVG